MSSEYVIYKLGPFAVPPFAPRYVRVYAPDEAQEKAPVLYLFDGQNMFHDAPSFAGGWHLHKTVRAFHEEGAAAPVVVGIDHGGTSRPDELSPYSTPRGGGNLAALLSWLRAELVPLVREQFRVSREPEQTVIGGSSLGGLAALYAHFHHPDEFGAALAMSPSLWVSRGAFFDLVDQRPLPEPSRIYLDAGAQEAGGAMLRHAERLARHLSSRGYPEESLRMVSDPEGAHRETDWRRRAPEALRWLLRIDPLPTRPPVEEAL
jgi:enterochelin esterase-like enzyme